MRTEELLKNVEIVKVIGTMPLNVESVVDDSRKSGKDSLFFCVKGNNEDGEKFIGEAIARGTTIIVGEKPSGCNVCFVVVKDIRDAMAKICAEFYGNPQDKLKIFGVVGTNGKTSVCHILSQIFAIAGKNTGIIGTLGITSGNETKDTGLTSPGTVLLYSTLADFVKNGTECLFMEVSAHAIAQKRVGGIFFECLIFTNCTEDHLDYFGNMEKYSSVKRSIFKKHNCKYAIVNVDDPTGREILCESDAETLTYGIDNPADVFAIDIAESERGISYIINLFDAIYDVDSPLLGECNVYNTLAAAACAAACGIRIHKIALALKHIKAVKGRAEFVCSVNGANVYIDYAHTPDGLKRTLTSFRKVCDGKLYCLFGCGGNREKEKRSVMGAISASLSDFTVITTDNPRFEDPCAIISEIESGVRKISRDYITIEDRKEAIGYAMAKLKKSDILIVAGKGAETYQDVLGVKRDFSDADVIAEVAATLDGQDDK